MNEHLRDPEQEIATLRKINRVLMERVERSVDSSGGAFAIFEQNILLQHRVEARTAELLATSRRLADLLELQRKVSTQLAESEARFDQLAEQNRSITWEVNASGSFTYVSRVVELVLGYRSDELIGKKCLWDLHLEADRETYKTSLLDAFGKKERFTSIAHTARAKDGRIVWLTTSGVPIVDTAGVLLGYHGIDTDVTERKRAEERIRQLEKAESLGRMAGAVAHHYNNMMAVVLGHLELALLELPEHCASTREDLTEAMRAARRAAEMGGMMLAYLGQSMATRELLDFSGLCRQGLPELKGGLPDRIGLNIEIPDSGVVVCANAGQLRHILNSLVINAQEAVVDGPGMISVRLQKVTPNHIPHVYRLPFGFQPKADSYACLEVEDTGCGIAEGDIERIFDPFYSTKFTGRGLSLAVALGAIKAHGGCLSVASEPGQGSIFRVYLPLASDDIVPTLALGHPVADDSFLSGLVLVAEDEDAVRGMTAHMLERLGFSVLEARDGRAAVEVFRERSKEIVCVICDLTMPRLDGWKTIAALRSIQPGLPIVLASGYDEANVMQASHEERPQAFLHKPFQLMTLKEALRKAMWENRLRQEFP